MGIKRYLLTTMSKRGKTQKKEPEKFRAHKYERPGLSEDEVEEIKEAFVLFDNDGSGAISVNELTSAMQSLGFDVKHAVVYNMVADLDADGSEEIDRVFKLFDKDRNGTLEADDLSRVCKELGEDMTEEDIREVIGRMDVDGDGAVGLDDFYAVITKKTFE